MTLSDFALFVSLLLCAVLFVGCGNEALRTNAIVARSMLSIQTESSPAIREARIEAAVDAGRQAHAEGLPEDVAQQRAAEAADEWQCAIDGHRVYAGAVGAYIDAIVLVEAGADFSIADVVPFVTRAVNAYRSLASCLRSLGSSVLPEPGFLDLIPPSWETETAQ